MAIKLPVRVRSRDEVVDADEYIVALTLGTDEVCKSFADEIATALNERTALIAERDRLREEVERLRAVIANCDWYWQEDDTSSDGCRSGPYEHVDDEPPGTVVAVSRGGVVETRYYAILEADESSKSDDYFYVDEATEAEAKAAVDAELARRAALGEGK